MSLTIAAGEKVAFVGASGAGETTVAGLLLGFYAPTSGQIRVDAVPQPELDMRWLRRRTALVMQERILLSGTIAENIRFGRADASGAGEGRPLKGLLQCPPVCSLSLHNIGLTLGCL